MTMLLRMGQDLTKLLTPDAAAFTKSAKPSSCIPGVAVHREKLAGGSMIVVQYNK
jgi:hypothetical protein